MIEILKREDIPQLLEIYNKLFENKFDYDIEECFEKFEKIINNPNYLILVAKSDNKIVGTVTAIVNESFAFKTKNMMVVDYLYVEMKYRKKKIASRMFNMIEKFAREKKCGYILFVSSKNRKTAHKFYEKMNYVEEKGFRKVII